MKLLERKSQNYSNKVQDYYYFDSINDSDDILQLFNMLRTQATEIDNYSVEFDHDHTSEGKPIKCCSDEELALLLSSVDLVEINKIVFAGKINETDIYGRVIPRTAILAIEIPVKKNELNGPVR